MVDQIIVAVATFSLVGHREVMHYYSSCPHSNIRANQNKERSKTTIHVMSWGVVIVVSQTSVMKVIQDKKNIDILRAVTIV